MNEIVFMPAHELARAIRERRLSSREVLEAAILNLARAQRVKAGVGRSRGSSASGTAEAVDNDGPEMPPGRPRAGLSARAD